MRYTEFLLEYDRSREQTRIEAVPTYQARRKQDPDFSLEQLESADPTPQQIYVPRLATWWLAGEPTEDLISTTADALAKYHALKIKKKLKPEHADIGRFKTADQFTDAVSGYQLPGDAAPPDRGKYTEIHRDSQLIVVQLLDKTAAVFWGQGTKWCTAARNNNQFAHYAAKGPLYVIVDRVNHTRYQLWWDQTDAYQFQFMDVQDADFNPTQLPFYHQLQPIFAPLHPHLMWQTNPSLDDQLAAVQSWGWAIQWISNPTPEVQLAAVGQNGYVIRLIPKPTPEVQLAAVEQNGDAIQWIPNPTLQVQQTAVEQNGWAIEYIPTPSFQMQQTAVKYSGWTIQFILDPDPTVQEEAVRQTPDAIYYIKNPTPAAQALAKQLRQTK